MRPGNRQESYRMYKYGLLPGDYDQWYEAQDGCCVICGTHQDDLREPLHIDHCHKTDEVRGLLCRTCNVGLGYFKDNPERLDAAREYLLKFQSRTINDLVGTPNRWQEEIS
jgi:hypothetical protein